MLQINLKTLWLGLGGLAAFTLVSFLVTPYPIASAVAMIIALTVFAIICYRNRWQGLLLALGELVVGSKGYLLSISIAGNRIPLRLGIFLILIAIWLLKDFNLQAFIQNVKSRLDFKIYLALIGIIAFGGLNGYLRGHGLSGVFLDLNGYLFIGLFPIFISLIDSRKRIQEALEVMFISTLHMGILTIFSAYLFFHKFAYVGSVYYRWLRNAGLAEITRLSPDADFYRIFFQSHIYLILTGGIILAALVANRTGNELIQKNKSYWLLSATLSIILSSLLISASRSIWLGGIAIIFLTLTSSWLIVRTSTSAILNSIAGFIKATIPAAIGGVLITFIVLNFPLPLPQNLFDFGVLGKRLTISGEAGVNSRWKQLPGLSGQIKTAPLLGSGFGTTVTYNTDDPRIKNESNPSGRYTTYSFEWGYLDTMTEVGIVGLSIVLLFILIIFRNGYFIIRNTATDEKLMAWSFLLALSGLIITHTVTPYLNHPLGLGFVMLSSASLSFLNASNKNS